MRAISPLCRGFDCIIMIRKKNSFLFIRCMFQVFVGGRNEACFARLSFFGKKPFKRILSGAGKEESQIGKQIHQSVLSVG